MPVKILALDFELTFGTRHKHQFSIDSNVNGEILADLRQACQANKINILAMDVYTFDRIKGQVAAIIMTNSELVIMVLPQGEKIDLQKPEGQLTAMYYEKTEKIILLGFLSTKTNKGGLRIYNEDGTKFQDFHDLHQKDITAIQTQDYMGTKLIWTTGKDGNRTIKGLSINFAYVDRVKAWMIQNEKLECVDSGISTYPLYSFACLDKR